MSKSLGTLKCEVRHGTPIQFTGSSSIYQYHFFFFFFFFFFIYQYHNENIPVLEIKCNLFFRFTASSAQKVKVTKNG